MTQIIPCLLLWLALAASTVDWLGAQPGPPTQERSLSVSNRRGMRLVVANDNADPELRLLLPNSSVADTSVRILFPEHVTALRRGDTTATQLFVFRAGTRGDRPDWRVIGSALEYERQLRPGLRVRARATLEDDGVRFLYAFANQSSDGYEFVTAVTDPRLTGFLLDLRLERTFVHHADGFDLLAAETPSRVSIPLDEWLPVRYLASYRWPVPPRRTHRRPDGVTYIYKSRPVDEPFIATRSTDGAWVVASFARDAGNVWSNPALTCQHVHQQAELGVGQLAVLEFKMLVVRASLDSALSLAREQRRLLQ
jgi:hypothetical protein